LYQESTSLVVVLDFTKSLLYTVKLPVKGTAEARSVIERRALRY